MSVVSSWLTSLHSLGYRGLGTVLRRLVVALVGLFSRKVLLRDPTVGMIVRVVVSDTVPEALRPLIVAIAQMRRHLTHRTLLHVGACIPNGKRRSIALRRSSEMDRCLAEVQLGLG